MNKKKKSKRSSRKNAQKNKKEDFRISTADTSGDTFGKQEESSPAKKGFFCKLLSIAKLLSSLILGIGVIFFIIIFIIEFFNPSALYFLVYTNKIELQGVSNINSLEQISDKITFIRSSEANSLYKSDDIIYFYAVSDESETATSKRNARGINSATFIPSEHMDDENETDAKILSLEFISKEGSIIDYCVTFEKILNNQVKMTISGIDDRSEIKIRSGTTLYYNRILMNADNEPEAEVIIKGCDSVEIILNSVEAQPLFENVSEWFGVVGITAREVKTEVDFGGDNQSKLIIISKSFFEEQKVLSEVGKYELIAADEPLNVKITELCSKGSMCIKITGIVSKLMKNGTDIDDWKNIAYKFFEIFK